MYTIFAVLIFLYVMMITAAPPGTYHQDHLFIPEGSYAKCGPRENRIFSRADVYRAVMEAQRELAEPIKDGSNLAEILASRTQYPTLYSIQVPGYQAPFMMFPILVNDVYVKSQYYLHLDIVILDANFQVAQILNGVTWKQCPLFNPDHKGTTRAKKNSSKDHFSKKRPISKGKKERPISIKKDKWPILKINSDSD
ncbi:hypothetical protein K3495_g11091 [Podosphaera aphanis]|nr:hypothetical protein K3495_g11091 [Podosphaera aphanis]